MSEDSKTPKPTGKIEFIENHRPALPSGDYEITVTQSIVATKPPLATPAGQDNAAQKKPTILVNEEFSSQTREFSVQGPRFTLNPQIVREVFPPAGSLGEHSSVLPHISFNRSTLPWERFAKPLVEDERIALEKPAWDRNDDENKWADTQKLKTPWLALLLFDQDEFVEKKDDLKQIVGIGPVLEAKLHEQGIYTYRQLAEMTPAKVGALKSSITGFPDRIERDKWIEQAAKLSDEADRGAKVSGPKACTLELDYEGDHWSLIPGTNTSEPQGGLLEPTFPHESGQQDGDPVIVIDVARDLLEAILPSFDDVLLLGHVRQPTDDLGTPVGDQVATLLANRLPKAGHMSVVHLVSLEGKYGSEENDIWNLPGNQPFVRLVSLKNWRFTCLSEEHSFKGLLNGLNRTPSTLRLPSEKLDAARQYIEQGYVPMPHEMRQGNRSVSWYRGPLAPGRVGYDLLLLCLKKVDKIPTRLSNTVIVAKVSDQLHFRVFDAQGPKVAGSMEKWLPDRAAEIDALKKELKDLWGKEDLDVSQKNEIVHSVLSILGLNRRENPSEGSLRTRSADQLVRYNPTNAMFDVSYAAAWELGRLLTLQNEKVAVSLLDWKRRHRHSQERQRAMKVLEHMPIVGQSVATELPTDVRRWFADLALLWGVPFNYLVPSERMLPQESIRFFWIDPEWIRCLHDGAFSIGRVLPSDHKRDAAHDEYLLGKPHAIVSGFLLRSEVVSGWPNLQVDGYDEAVKHKNYEHEALPPHSPVRASITNDRELQDAMNNGDASMLSARFGFVDNPTLAVSPIVEDSRWLVNVNENETLYLVEKTEDGLQLSIENKLPLLKMQYLSPNVLLCLFAGDVKTVDIHQKPEALHFGLNRSGTGHSVRYYRELKSHRGGKLRGCKVDIPWRTEEENGKKKQNTFTRVISIHDFSCAIQKKLGSFPPGELEAVAKNAVGEQRVTDFKVKFNDAAESATSAQFALQTAEGVQKVRFVVKQTPAGHCPER